MKCIDCSSEVATVYLRVGDDYYCRRCYIAGVSRPTPEVRAVTRRVMMAKNTQTAFNHKETA